MHLGYRVRLAVNAANGSTLLGMLVAAALTGDFGSRNVFERRAGLADGGYRDRPLRPPLARVARGSSPPPLGDQPALPLQRPGP